jgi:hypothetical protein
MTQTVTMYTKKNLQYEQISLVAYKNSHPFSLPNRTKQSVSYGLSCGQGTHLFVS